jgi:hypothetical protein
MIESNLYTKEGKPSFKKSYCGYIDILGFGKKILENDIDFFNKYLNTLTQELDYLNDIYNSTNNPVYKTFELKTFTDNLVFGLPWRDRHGESDLGNIFEILSHLQLTFIKHDIYLRGAVSLSSLYMNDNVVLGPAIIESYKLESEKAINPRIILSESVIKTNKTHFEFYANQVHKSSPPNKMFLIDTDGQYFINYLFILFWSDSWSYDDINNELAEHKHSIIRNLEINKPNIRIFENLFGLLNIITFLLTLFILNPTLKENLSY